MLASLGSSLLVLALAIFSCTVVVQASIVEGDGSNRYSFWCGKPYPDPDGEQLTSVEDGVARGAGCLHARQGVVPALLGFDQSGIVLVDLDLPICRQRLTHERTRSLMETGEDQQKDLSFASSSNSDIDALLDSAIFELQIELKTPLGAVLATTRHRVAPQRSHETHQVEFDLDALLSFGHRDDGDDVQLILSLRLATPDAPTWLVIDEQRLHSFAFVRATDHNDAAGVVRVDYRRPGSRGGTVLVGGDHTPFFPFAFFYNWGGYLQRGLELLDEVASAGFNVIHPVSPFDPPTTPAGHSLHDWFDRCHQLGLRFHYDLRHSYKNLTQVQLEVEAYRGHPALLSWYIADEPDGPGDDPALAVAAYRLVKRLDPRHPVSLVLNCRDSSPSFLDATDIMMTDVYPIGIDTTRCNATFGVCGCDGCEGRPSDVAHRLDHYRRSWPPALRHRMPIWIVLQAFGGEHHWSRLPTPQEIRLMTYLALMHDANGIFYWLYPIGDGDDATALEAEIGRLCREVLQTLAPFIIAAGSQSGVEISASSAGVHIRAWTNGSGDGAILLLVANTREETVTASIDVPWPGLWGTRMRRLFVADGDGDAADQLGLSTIRLTLAALETRAYLLVPPQPIDPLALLLAKLELHQHQQHQR